LAVSLHLLAASIGTALVAGYAGRGDGTAPLTGVHSAVKANSLCERSERLRSHRLETANGWAKGSNTSRPLKEKNARHVVIVPVEELVQEPEALGAVEGDPELSRYLTPLSKDVAGAPVKPLMVFAGVAFEDSGPLASKAVLSSCVL
jgi:hypothetical protein